MAPPQQQQQQQQQFQQLQQAAQPYPHAMARNPYLPPYAPPPHTHPAHMMIAPSHFRPPMAPPPPHGMPNVFAPPPPPHQPHPQRIPHPMPQRPPIHGHTSAPPPPPPFMQMQMQAQVVHVAPPTKKAKLNDGSAVDGSAVNDGLMDEQAFIAANGGGEKAVKIRIKVPSDDKKKHFQFNGQILTFTMKLSDAVNELKQRVFNVTTLAANKQKLKIQGNGMWLKDGASLAFYNLNGAQMLELHTRTRGGKKNK
mmetsp:Transcript_26531/g.43417  ORF Transcript_26531/g.43417 Transcript_26531/m.43417 type:complete len:253 (-) Transcript_26531:85-843(-)